MSDSAFIREALLDDIGAVQQLAGRTVERDLPCGLDRDHLLALEQRELRECIAHPRHGRHLLVAELDGEVVGFALLLKRQDPFTGCDVVHLHGLAVAEPVCGRGIASRLIAESETLALRDGAIEMTLNVFSDNQRARRLYGHLGFGEELVKYRKQLRADPNDNQEPRDK